MRLFPQNEQTFLKAWMHEGEINRKRRRWWFSRAVTIARRGFYNQWGPDKADSDLQLLVTFSTLTSGDIPSTSPASMLTSQLMLLLQLVSRALSCQLDHFASDVLHRQQVEEEEERAQLQVCLQTTRPMNCIEYPEAPRLLWAPENAPRPHNHWDSLLLFSFEQLLALSSCFSLTTPVAACVSINF